MAYEKPLPEVNTWNRPFWEAARRHELQLQKCDECGERWFPPEPVCPNCLSTNVSWQPVSGLGRIWSKCRFHHVYFKSMADDLPYNVVVVELDEGPILYSNLRGMDYKDVKVGLRVRAVFDDVTDEISLIRFEPTDA